MLFVSGMLQEEKEVLRLVFNKIKVEITQNGTPVTCTYVFHTYLLHSVAHLGDVLFT